MNVWLIGGGAYLAALGFAFALCSVAAPQDRRNAETGGWAPDPGMTSTGHEESVGSGLDETANALV